MTRTTDPANPIDTTAWRQRYADAMMRSFAPPLTMLERGEGCSVQDVDGKRYLDFLAGIAVNALGYAHPVWVEAISRQAATLAHVSNYFTTPQQLGLAERLLEISGAGAAGRVIFGNSGAEANEAALKLALLHRHATGKARILALNAGFHGRTTGTMALTGKPAQREPFGDLIQGIDHLDSTLEALEAGFGDDVAALILEPIKGEAGVRPLPDGFLRRARELATEHGALLIVDEIQTGIGRTGAWFGFQHEGIAPDAITVAKGLGGGVPIGALIAFESAADLLQAGMHGSTFGGNPLATGTALAVLDEIERSGLIANAAARGQQLHERIAGIGSPLVEEVRGRGLLLGIALTAPIATELRATAQHLGLIVNAANESTIRIAPPLIVGDAEIDEFIALFTEALEAHA